MSGIKAVSPEAILIMQGAFEQFKQVVAIDDSTAFQSTQLQDVENAARQLERTLVEQPNIGRLRHLFSALKRYSEALVDLCHGTPFMSWLWAPIRLTLEITENHPSALARLIAAYKRMASAIPHFDTISSVYRSRSECQQVLAILFANIIDFHRRVYMLLKRPGWIFFFESSWDKYERRFHRMLEDLTRHGQLIHNEASLNEVNGARELRERKLEELTRLEDEQSVTELSNVKLWLAASDLDQEDSLDELQTRCYEGSCDWIYDHPKIKSWIRPGVDHNVLWLKGKPGSGKSVLCSKLIQSFSSSEEFTVLYLFCMEASPKSKQCHSMLRGLIRQLIQKKSDLCAFVQKQFVDKGLNSSLKQLRECIRTLLNSFASVRIIVDGLDECDEKEQKAIIAEMLALTTLNNPKRFCKILISSHDVKTISYGLRGRSVIDLSHERAAIQMAISSFVRARIAQSPVFCAEEIIDQASLKKAEQTLVGKADGMFLWVQLVISTLENAYTSQEMQQALDDLPEGLDKVYKRIFTRIQEQNTASNSDRASRIFQWLACSERPLKKYELQIAVTLCPDNERITEDTKVNEQVFELCKPLVENGAGDVIRFVHTSVKQFILEHQLLFQQSTAQFHVAYSCLAYLNLGVTLIDDQYEDEFRLVEVGKGFHGLCQYASRYWIDHLLAYMTSIDTTSDITEDTIIKLASSLAQVLSTYAIGTSVMQNEITIEKHRRLDPRAMLLKGHEPLYSLVLSTVEMHLSEKIRPRAEENPANIKHPILLMRQKYDSLATQVMNADLILGLDLKTLAGFKKTYGSSILVCRFTNCQRASQGFVTVHERDSHEKTHVQAYKCPQSECSMHRTGLANAKKLQQHLEQYHPKLETITDAPKLRPFAELRTATDATLVGTPPANAYFKNTSALSDDAASDGDEGEDDDIMYGKLDAFATTNNFALGSTEWT